MSDDDPRFACASRHASKIDAATKALDTAIYEANRDGYRAALRVRNVVPIQMGDGEARLIGGDEPISISATIVFDIGHAVL